jgi:hypothetical protein
MRRRHGTTFVLAGVCLGLASGCLTTLRDRAPAAPERPEAPAAAPPASPPSPYHVTPVDPPPHPVPVPDRVAPPDLQTAVAPAAPSDPAGAANPPPAEKVLLIRPPDDPPLVEALRRLLKARPGEPEPLLQGYSASDQKLVLDLLQAAARCGDRGDRAALDAQLQHLAAVLRERAPLELGAVWFCSEIKGFGVYRKLRADDPGGVSYQVGADGLPGEPMQLYIEVRNFHSRELGGAFETRLGAHVEIEDGSNHPVAHIDLGTRCERSLSPRQDYYITLTIPVPARLPVGQYTLKLWVRDETEPPGGQSVVPRVARSSLPFRVVDRASRAGPD